MIEAVQRKIPHGTPSGYSSHGCRCDACRAAEIQRQRDWRKRHRAGKVRHAPDHPLCTPVRVRGVDYPSISIAAAALHVSPSSIVGQLRRRGSADGAGLGGHAPRKVTPARNAKRCVIHSREFASIAGAARYLGVNYAHLFRQLQGGLKPKYSDYLLSKLMAADLRHSAQEGGYAGPLGSAAQP